MAKVISPVRQSGASGREIVWLWENVEDTDTCEPAYAHGLDDPTISAFGTFGATPLLVALHGTPETISTPTNYFVCTSSGTAISLGVTGAVKVVDQVAIAFKPVVTVGEAAVTDVDIYLVLK